MLVFELAFGKVSIQDKLSITQLWKKEGVLNDENIIDARLGQVVYLVRDAESGALAGVSTAEKIKVQALNNNYFYEFRCFIGVGFRAAGLDIKLCKSTIDYLETIVKEDVTKPIGVFTILENETLKSIPRMRSAYWPVTDMYFVGFTSSGNSIHVHYFKRVRI
jgi:hypothetical protein